MSRRTAIVACALASGVLALAAQDQQGQTQQPIFRREVDLIRLDVSVLDKQRHPVRGLTAEDFEVKEDGKAQRVVAVAEIDLGEHDPLPTAWMRHVPRDVVANDIVDQVGDGRIIGLVVTAPNSFGRRNNDLLLNARAIGHYVVDHLGASDVAAVIYPSAPGLTEDFTADRTRLHAALDRFDADPYQIVMPTPQGVGPREGDMMQRFAPILMRSECQRNQPAVPALYALVSRLATIPNRRKTVVVVAQRLVASVGGRGQCGELYQMMMETFRKAQRGNVNIYSVDPSQYDASPGAGPDTTFMNGRMFEADMLQTAADETGGRVLRGGSANEINLDGILGEGAAYYLVGYQSSNPKADGKFRRVDVSVKRKDIEVRTRSGVYSPRAGEIAAAENREAPPSIELGLTGMFDPAGLPLRITAVPIGPTDAYARTMEVLLMLGIRWPAPRGTTPESLTLVRNLYDPDGRAGPLEEEKLPLEIRPNAGDDVRQELVRTVTLPPGRYEVRYNVHSRVLDRGASIYADIEVPDLTRAGVVVTPILLGAATADPAPVVSVKLPIAPTTARDFAPTDRLEAFLRVFQGGIAPLVPVTMSMQVLDIENAALAQSMTVLAPAMFTDAGRGAPYQFTVPLERLRHGPHLLSITATAAGAPAVRRDIVFRVR